MTRLRFTAGTATLGLVVAYVLVGAIVYQLVGDGTYLFRLTRPAFWEGIAYVAPFSALVVLVGYRLRARDAEGRRITDSRIGWRTAWQDARRSAFSPPRLRYALVVALVAPLFFNAFTAWKSLIPVLHPFAADAALARLDAAIHGGPPHRLLFWLPLTWLDFVYYYVWTEVLVFVITILAWCADSRILLALTAAWVLLGTLLATIVSSAGPPYYFALTGQDLYRDLFQYLATAKNGGPVMALDVQQSLWLVYTRHSLISGTGISAFPSMHVAVPSVLAFGTWARSRPLSLCLAAYAALILVCSVALGWHYAVDGYASVLAAGAIWWAVRHARLDPEAAS